MIHTPYNPDFIKEKTEHLQSLIQSNQNIPFRFTKIFQKYIGVKVAGLFALARFSDLPWEYNKIEKWTAVFPYLQNKVFFCRIKEFNPDPLFISIHAKVPQFKKEKLNTSEKYKGIVLDKVENGLWIDIGYHFNWACGSIQGFLKRINFSPSDDYDMIKTGDLIETNFWKRDVDYYEFGIILENKPWHDGQLKALTGKTIAVQVRKKTDGYVDFTFENKYRVQIDINFELYPGYKNDVLTARKNMVKDDVIHCTVKSVKSTNQIMVVRWYLKNEIIAIKNRNPDVT